MIINDKSQRGLGAFGSFGDWRAGKNRDTWENWCDQAEQAWIRVTGNAVQAEEYAKKCWGVGSVAIFEPWTMAGLAVRGLPQNWSPYDNSVAAGGAATGNKLLAVGKDVVSNPPPAVIPVVENAKKTVEAVTGISMGTSGASPSTQSFQPATLTPTAQPARMTAGPVTAKTFLATTMAAPGTAVVNPLPPPPSSISSKLPLILGGVAVVGLGAFLLLGRKRGGAVAGFSGYKAKRRSRRSRRSRR